MFTNTNVDIFTKKKLDIFTNTKLDIFTNIKLKIAIGLFIIIFFTIATYLIPIEEWGLTEFNIYERLYILCINWKHGIRTHTH
jgi:hypothetical protein